MNFIYIFLISAFTALISYLVAKKRILKLNKSIIIRSILWVEANVFLIIYFITDIYEFKIGWSVFMFLASVVTIVPIISKK